MTRLPMLDQDVTPMKGDDYPSYRVGPICSHPACSRYVAHIHHLWRRSFTIGPYDWVKLPDGTVVGNISGLCSYHHEQVTVNEAKIECRKRDDRWVFFWVDPRDTDSLDRPLVPQPPIRGVTTSHDQNGHHRERHVHGEGVEKCPACQRPLPRAKIESSPEKSRARKSWTVTVPADRAEDGAEVLDVLLESARLILEEAGIQYGDERKVRYYILSTALALFVQHGELIVSDQ